MIKDLFLALTSPIFKPSKDRGADGAIERKGDFAKMARQGINYRLANGTHIPAISLAHVSGVVGEGINIQARFGDDNLNSAFEKYLRIHGRRENLEVTGRFNFNELVRQIEHFKFVNGGVLIRFHYSDQFDIPLRLELIGVDMIDTSKNDEKTRNGLQKDRFGKITHFWIFEDDKKAKSRRVAARNIFYYMQPWLSISQYTAVSQLITLIPTLEKYDEYLGAELKSALNKAKAGVYWSTELYSVIMERLDELKKTEGLEEAAKTAAEIIAEMADRGIGVTGAVPIPNGDTIHKPNSNNDSVFATLSDTSLKTMTSAVGESITTATRDVQQGNYASLKMDAVLGSRIHKMQFDQLRGFISEYLERLLEIGVRMGDIPIPIAEFYANKYDYFGKWEIMRRIDDAVDEVKQAQSRQINLDSGTTTISRIYSEQGLDYEAEIKKQIELDIKIELMRREMYQKAGLTPPEEKDKKPIKVDDNEN